MEKILFDIDPYTFTGSAIIIGLLLTQELPINEQGTVGNWLQLIGLIIQTYSSQSEMLETKRNTNQDKTEKDIENLKKAIKKIQEQLEKL